MAPAMTQSPEAHWSDVLLGSAPTGALSKVVSSVRATSRHDQGSSVRLMQAASAAYRHGLLEPVWITCPLDEEASGRCTVALESVAPSPNAPVRQTLNLGLFYPLGLRVDGVAAAWLTVLPAVTVQGQGDLYSELDGRLPDDSARIDVQMDLLGVPPTAPIWCSR